MLLKLQMFTFWKGQKNMFITEYVVHTCKASYGYDLFLITVELYYNLCPIIVGFHYSLILNTIGFYYCLCLSAMKFNILCLITVFLNYILL